MSKITYDDKLKVLRVSKITYDDTFKVLQGVSNNV